MRYGIPFLTVIVFMLVVSAIPTGSTTNVNLVSSPMSLAGEGLVEGVPYVWQEMNGFCAWAATSIAFQAAGVDADLHDIFALTSIGFSFGYIRYNDTMLMFPGALYDQVGPVDFVADMYGVNYTQFIADYTPGADQAKQVWESQGINVGLLSGETDAFNLMRSTIDSGYPLLISVDPIWLPAPDYDVLRESGASGGGHGILVVGYNDTSGSATIIDPGVGSFGDNFGYPDDGRGNYTEILYTALNNAWAPRYYISSVFKPQGAPLSDRSDRLGMLIRDKLLGVGTTYSPSGTNAYLWSFGEAGFRQMGNDFTPSVLQSYLSVFSSTIFDSPEDEQQFKSTLLLLIGLGAESTISLQYLSYRTALERLPKFVNEDLSAFLDSADDALPHMAAISSNTTMIYPGNLTVLDAPISTTFFDISQEYNSTGDLEVALNNHAVELAEISGHLIAIADSWRVAGNALVEIWPNDPLVLYGPLLIVAGSAVVIIAAVVIMKIKRTPSQ
ncbi:MAG: hypothetical protein ACFFF4_02650 [Candidatus Thorarchaeota archaeon]